MFKHPEKYPEIKCDQCDYVSVNPRFLKNHMNNHKIGLIKNDTEETDEKSRDIANTVEVFKTFTFISFPIHTLDFFRSFLQTVFCPWKVQIQSFIIMTQEE